MQISIQHKKLVADKRETEKRVFVTLDYSTKEWENIREDGRRIMRVGTGERKDMTPRKLISLIRRIIRTAKANRSTEVVLTLSEFVFPKLKLSAEELGVLIAREAELANFDFNLFKTKPKEGWRDVEKLTIVDLKRSKNFARGIERGAIIGMGVNEARVLSNTPGGDMTPEKLAEAAETLSHGTSIKVTVFGKSELEREKMGAILGVGRGAKAEPRFIIMDYRGGRKSEKPIVLVGKGITFDTGGLNVKPGRAMTDMHMDMSGGAAVMLAVVLAEKLGIKRNVIALIPAAENAVSGDSIRPGDIVRSHSGKTIEVLNTDAEGRLILADALSYAKKYKPRLVVDVATLTGSSIAALGQKASAILTKDENLQKLFVRLGEESGDYVWPMPLWEEYEEDVKGVFADVANIPTNGAQGGDVIDGAVFLLQFAEGYPWVHIDIAPRMTSIPSDYLGKGATGVPVRLLVKLLQTYK
ncbi:MAG: leucyl aminopeptidase family protein [Parcubacteria group bacterium]|nr:leucyl aminopeptidase family protein [Parcubacteria group bacterium]